MLMIVDILHQFNFCLRIHRHSPRVSYYLLCVQIYPFEKIRMPVVLIWGPPKWLHLNLVKSAKFLFPNILIFSDPGGFNFSICLCWGTQRSPQYFACYKLLRLLHVPYIHTLSNLQPFMLVSSFNRLDYNFSSLLPGLSLHDWITLWLKYNFWLSSQERRMG